MKGIFYNSKTGKKVSGAAAQQMLIKNNGGWVEHHKKFKAMLDEDYTQRYLATFEIELKRSNIRIV